MTVRSGWLALALLQGCLLNAPLPAWMEPDETDVGSDSDETDAPHTDGRETDLRDTDPPETDETAPPADTDETDPPDDTDEILPPIDTDETAPPDDTDEILPPIDTDAAAPPDDTDEATPPADTDEMAPPADTDEALPPADTDEALPPADTDETAPPADTDEAAGPSDTDETAPPVDTDEILPPNDTDETAPPIDTDEPPPSADTSQPPDTDTAVPPSETDDRPDTSTVDSTSAETDPPIDSTVDPRESALPETDPPPVETGLDDRDGDGYAPRYGDCDDDAGTVHPGATERCNGVDDDCDRAVDEPGAVGGQVWFRDDDGDQWGDAAAPVPACGAAPGLAAIFGDCDDDAAQIFPGAPERCNGADDDCDGDVDEPGAVDAPTWYADADRDQWGDAADAVQRCARPAGRVAAAGDCDEGDPGVHPEAPELCDGLDQDCDDVADDGLATEQWWADSDGDGFGDPATEVTRCAAPADHVQVDGDCDDGDGDVWPGAEEVPADGVDGDCDGLELCWHDEDGDGWGAAQLATPDCDAPGFAPQGDDCDDEAPDTNPGVLPACGDGDHDCDGQPDALVLQCCDNGLDDDGDGWPDAEDPDCLLAHGWEAGATAGPCNDGQDDDGDGVIDAADPGCADALSAEAPLALAAGPLTLTSDAEVAGLCATFTGVNGDLTISGAGVTDLSGLACLSEVRGDLLIEGTLAPELDLPRLVRVTGRLHVRSNPSLQRASAPWVASLHMLAFENNHALETIAAPRLITALTDSATFSGLSALHTLTGLERLETVVDLRFSELDALEALPDMPALRRIDRFFSLIAAPLVTDLVGLSALEEVGRQVMIQNDPGLRSVRFPRLSMVGELVELYGVAALVDLDLPALVDTPATVRVWEAASLRDLRGLASLQRVGELTISNNASLSDLTALSSLVVVDRGLSVGSCASLPTLYGLHHVETVGGVVGISRNPQLRSLRGLDALTSAGELRVTNNGGIRFLSGLESLQVVTGALRFAEEASLYDITSLDVLTLAGGVVIEDNPALVSVSSLHGLATIGGDLRVNGNPLLTEMTGLESTTTIQGSVYIEENAALETLSLIRLQVIDGSLLVEDNAALPALDLQQLETVGDRITITGNDSLTSVDGLSNLRSVGSNFVISSNVSLCESAVAALATWLYLPIETWGSNDSGC